MNPHATTLLTLASGLAAAAAHAQSFTTDSTITMTMSWREATSTGGTVPNPDGILEPGEYAMILMDVVSFTNQGGVANFAPPIGTFTSGTVLGFEFGAVDINGFGGTVGEFNTHNPMANAAGTSGFGTRGSWRVQSEPGVVNAASDGIGRLQFGQFPANPSGANSDDPITNMFRFLWTPASFAPRIAGFRLVPSPFSSTAAGVYLDLDHASGAGVYVAPSNINLGSVSIPIAPAPPTLVVAAAALTALRRRRPRGRDCP